MFLLGSVFASVRADEQLQSLDGRGETQLALKEFDDALGLRAQQPDRARILFRSSAKRLQNVIGSGVTNARLEYDLGNALLQSGDIGRAIVHYRRAEQMIPRDPLLADNLKVARARAMTQIKPADRLGLLRGLAFWHYDTSVAERAWTALALYVLGWVLLSLRAFIRSRGLALAGIVGLGVACMLGASVAVTTWTNRNHPEGVITSMDVAVHRGPSVNDERLFQQPLQPGVEFTTLERRGQWWKIELVDGNSGWIQGTTAELIPIKASVF